MAFSKMAGLEVTPRTPSFSISFCISPPGASMLRRIRSSHTLWPRELSLIRGFSLICFSNPSKSSPQASIPAVERQADAIYWCGMTLQDRLRETLALPDDDTPYGRALQLLLEDATTAGVSDVHLNPTLEGLEVLYRRDGVLQPQGLIDRARAERMIGKVKVLAGLLTYRRDVPQDGQIPAADAGGRSDVRVSLFPTVHGEKAVLRFFLHDPDQFQLDRLGYSAAVAGKLRAAARRPDGVIL